MPVGPGLGAPAPLVFGLLDELDARVFFNRVETLPDEVPWFPDGPTCTFEAYAAWETSLLDLLGDRSLSMEDRLDELARQLHAEGGQRPKPETASAGTVPVPSVPPAFPVTIDRLMACYVVARSLKARVKGPTTWSGQMVDPIDQHWPLDTIADGTDGDLVTRFLRQVLFRLIDLAEIGVVGHIHRVVWIGRAIHHLARFCAASDGRTEIIDEDVESAVEAAEKAFMHNRGFFEKLAADATVSAWLHSPGAVTENVFTTS